MAREKTCCSKATRTRILWEVLCTCQRLCRYCGDCVVPLTDVPRVALPIEVRIVTHHAERDRGNTGVHAALLAPKHVQLVPFDQVTIDDAAGSAVLFPADDAEPASELALDEMKRLYIIDSRWAQASVIMGRPEFAAMRKVRLSGSAKSCYWRFHTKNVSDGGALPQAVTTLRRPDALNPSRLLWQRVFLQMQLRLQPGFSTQSLRLHLSAVLQPPKPSRQPD